MNGEELFGGLIVPERFRKKRKHLSPKQGFLIFMSNLFGATLVGKVAWMPREIRGAQHSFQANVRGILVTIGIYGDEYVLDARILTPNGSVSVEGIASETRQREFGLLFWAILQSFPVREMINVGMLQS